MKFADDTIDTSIPGSDADSPSLYGQQDEYPSTTNEARQDPDFKASQRGISKQAGYTFGKAKTAAEKLGDTEENREQIKEEAKERIRKYAKDKIKDKFGEEVADLSKDAIKKAAKDSAKKAGKQIVKNVGTQVGKEVAKEGVRVGAEVGGKVAAGAAATGTAEGVVAAAGVASAPETLGIGLLIAVLLEIAMYLGLSDAIDCAFELAKGDLKKALFHAHKAGMLILMGFILIIAIGLSFSIVGWIIAVPIMVVLTIYMILGKIFPNIGLLQGLSKRLLQGIVIAVDLQLIIVFLLIFAALLWYTCETSGLGSGIFANVATKVASWASGTTFLSTMNDVCTQLGKF